MAAETPVPTQAEVDSAVLLVLGESKGEGMASYVWWALPISVSYMGIYDSLDRLAADGLVEMGTQNMYWQITDQGRAALKEKD